MLKRPISHRVKKLHVLLLNVLREELLTLLNAWSNSKFEAYVEILYSADRLQMDSAIMILLATLANPGISMRMPP